MEGGDTGPCTTSEAVSSLWHRDERPLFADRSLYTADSENEEDQKPTKKTNIKTEESSGRERAASEGSPKPLNSMLLVISQIWNWLVFELL